MFRNPDSMFVIVRGKRDFKYQSKLTPSQKITKPLNQITQPEFVLIYILEFKRDIFICLVWFYGISTIEGFLMPNAL